MKKMLFVVLILTSLCIVLFAMFFTKIENREGFFRYAIPSMPETLDPGKMSGVTEGYLSECIFEGLMQSNPSDGELPEECKHLDYPGWRKGKPLLGIAESFTISEDGLTYTFKLRDSYWVLPAPKIDGVTQTPEKFRKVTAQDFVYSWKRVLDPATGSPYAQLIFVIKNSENFFNKKFIDYLASKKVTGKDEIILNFKELKSSKPAGIKEKLENVIKEKEAIDDLEKQQNIFVEILNSYIDALKRGKVITDGIIQSNQLILKGLPEKAELIKLSEPAIYARDEKTIEVTLTYVTPYFLDLCAFHTMLPVCPENFDVNQHPSYKDRIIELKKLHNITDVNEENNISDLKEYEKELAKLQEKLTNLWWRIDNLIYNGAYQLTEWEFQQQIVFEPNVHYWDVKNNVNQGVFVRIVSDSNTSVNLFYGGELDFIDGLPPNIEEELIKRNPDGTKKYPEFHSDNYLGTYFYRLNVTQEPLSNVWLRRALNCVIDRKTICEVHRSNLCMPATGWVAKGMPGYPEFQGFPFDKERAQTYLKKSGLNLNDLKHPLALIYNTSEGHKKLAILIQEQISNNFNLSIDLRNMEWKSYLNATRKLDYNIARAGWIGDYVDPNTFMDMFISNGGNNNTGWSNKRYDRIVLEYCPDIINWLDNPEKRTLLLADIAEYEKRIFGADTWLITNDEFDYWHEFFDTIKAEINNFASISDTVQKIGAAESLRFKLFQWGELILCFDEAAIIPLYYYKHNTMYKTNLKGIYENLRCHSPKRWIRIED